jgi:hypothetical protein
MSGCWEIVVDWSVGRWYVAKLQFISWAHRYSVELSDDERNLGWIPVRILTQYLNEREIWQLAWVLKRLDRGPRLSARLKELAAKLDPRDMWFGDLERE